MKSKYISVKFLSIPKDIEKSKKVLQMIQLKLTKKNIQIIIDWLNKELKKESEVRE